MANPAIADTLQLSRHTVESHLKRIYTKLAVNRLQLAAIVSRSANG
jgi:DNA-binding CsgD family transcriptional regulator